MMTVYVLFSQYVMEDFREAESFIDIYSTREKAQAEIDERVRKQRLQERRSQIETAFWEQYEKKFPPPRTSDMADRPAFDHRHDGDPVYNKQHADRLAQWNEFVLRPFQDRLRRYHERQSVALSAYMLLRADLEAEDLSTVEFPNGQDRYIIKEIEIK